MCNLKVFCLERYVAVFAIVVQFANFDIISVKYPYECYESRSHTLTLT